MTKYEHILKTAASEYLSEARILHNEENCDVKLELRLIGWSKERGEICNQVLASTTVFHEILSPVENE